MAKIISLAERRHAKWIEECVAESDLFLVVVMAIDPVLERYGFLTKEQKIRILEKMARGFAWPPTPKDEP